MANQAAWIKTPGTSLEVDSAPEAKLGPGQVVIKNAYVAINPVDWKIQSYSHASQPYPNILGRDIAGEIVEVGADVTRLRVGQRVIAHALGRITNEPKYGGFQLYTVAYEITVSPIPDSIPYEQAVVLPLAISTAAAGLYQKGYLEVPYPTLNPKPSGQTILVWGGSSSVGSTTIQFAVASGLEVVSTASKKNLDFLKSLGAKHVFDHSSPTVVEDIIAVLKGSQFVGAYDAISLPETMKAAAEIVHQLGGGKVVTVLGAPSEGLPSNVQAIGASSIDIATKQPEVGDAVWRKYVPEALKEGKLLPKPDPIVIKGGLDHIQEGLDTLKKGVSAAKVVVEL
ncbi:oxidoreductase-like protein [Mollisia scopiformis]|uniref:Oxidoreductase-like protein n=1 Tax=Mollisia scopiformis TaxID=149040 RepID=A0A132BDN1_MOLSC|nr:oxidoreductase-like protein [Mollisia scopiformis]KUJ10525.1 oxidoreductase-like protein [Mollisia scopiformis]